MAAEAVLRQEFPVKGGDFAKAGTVACRIKELLKEIGLDAATVRRAAIAAYEAEMNVIMYADSAEVELSVLSDAVRVVMQDRGPGIPDIPLAMQEGYSTATPEMRQRGFGAGLGLPNIKRNSDEFEITSEVGVGTTLRYGVLLRAADAQK